MKTKHFTPILILLLFCPGLAFESVAEVRDAETELSAEEMESLGVPPDDSLEGGDLDTETPDDLALADIGEDPGAAGPPPEVQDENIEAEIRAESARQELAELEQKLSESEASDQG